MARSFLRRRASRYRTAFLLAVGAVLVACQDRAPAPSAGETPSADAAAGTVHIALHGDPANLDPHLQSEVIAQAILGNVYDSLVTFDADMRLVPQLAQTWSNPDELTWRFELRDGQSFHDGRPVTAADVVASLERVRSHPRSRQSGSLVAVAEIVAPDSNTVELHTHHPYAVLLNKLAYLYIVPANAPDEIALPVGSGPYRFLGQTPASADGQLGHLELEAVPADPRNRDRPARVEYSFEPSRQARLAGLLSGRYDIVDDLGLPDLGQVQGREDVRIESRSSLLVTYLQLDPNRPPFDDLRVRRAIDMAIDREDLVKRVFGSFAEPLGQMVSQNVFGHSPDLGVPRRDVLGARLLLAEAGYRDGLELTLEHREGRAVMAPLRDQLADVGIEVTLDAQPWSRLYQRLQTGTVDFYLGGWVCTSADAGDLFDAKAHTPDRASGYGRANYVAYSNPELDGLIEEANQTASVEQRGRLWRRGLAIMARDLTYVPLFSQHEVYGVRSRVSWRPRQDGRVYGRDIHLAPAPTARVKER